MLNMSAALGQQRIFIPNLFFFFFFVLFFFRNSMRAKKPAGQEDHAEFFFALEEEHFELILCIMLERIYFPEELVTSVQVGLSVCCSHWLCVCTYRCKDVRNRYFVQQYWPSKTGACCSACLYSVCHTVWVSHRDMISLWGLLFHSFAVGELVALVEKMINLIVLFLTVQNVAGSLCLYFHPLSRADALCFDWLGPRRRGTGDDSVICTTRFFGRMCMRKNFRFCCLVLLNKGEVISRNYQLLFLVYNDTAVLLVCAESYLCCIIRCTKREKKKYVLTIRPLFYDMAPAGVPSLLCRRKKKVSRK